MAVLIRCQMARFIAEQDIQRAASLCTTLKICLTEQRLKRGNEMASKGLYANIHAKRKRIASQKASGAKKVERMRKPGSKGAPTNSAFKKAARSAKRK
jgi:hypothetical protein